MQRVLPVRGMASESQFLFDAVLLGLFGGITWIPASRYRSPDRGVH